jgi:hypothetical protein
MGLLFRIGLGRVNDVLVGAEEGAAGEQAERDGEGAGEFHDANRQEGLARGPPDGTRVRTRGNIEEGETRIAGGE